MKRLKKLYIIFLISVLLIGCGKSKENNTGGTNLETKESEKLVCSRDTRFGGNEKFTFLYAKNELYIIDKVEVIYNEILESDRFAESMMEQFAQDYSIANELEGIDISWKLDENKEWITLTTKVELLYVNLTYAEWIPNSVLVDELDLYYENRNDIKKMKQDMENDVLRYSCKININD